MWHVDLATMRSVACRTINVRYPLRDELNRAERPLGFDFMFEHSYSEKWLFMLFDFFWVAG